MVIGPSGLIPWLHELSLLYPELQGAYALHDAGLFWRSGCTEAARLLASGASDISELMVKKASSTTIASAPDATVAADGGAGADDATAVKSCRSAWVGEPPAQTKLVTDARTALLAWLSEHADVAALECTAVEHCHEVTGPCVH